MHLSRFICVSSLLYVLPSIVLALETSQLAQEKAVQPQMPTSASTTRVSDTVGNETFNNRKVTLESQLSAEVKVVGADSFIFEGDAIKWQLTNVGSHDAIIESIEITWPEQYGNLWQIVFNGKIFEGEVSPSSAIITQSQLGEDKHRTLKKEKIRDLHFKFDGEFIATEQDQISVSVSIRNGEVLYFSGGVLLLENSATDALAPGLPPDPAEAGKQTLEGIDSDRDGVRDDLQVAIAKIEYYSIFDKASALQSAAAYQKGILSGAKILNFDEVNKLILKAEDCMRFVFGNEQYPIQKELIKALVLNTPDRAAAFKNLASKYFEVEIDPEKDLMGLANFTVGGCRSACQPMRPVNIGLIRLCPARIR